MDRFLATAINWPQINDSLVINDAALSFPFLSVQVSVHPSVTAARRHPAGGSRHPRGFSVDEQT